MAATTTIAQLRKTAVGERFQVVAKVTESGTYTAGGSPITAAQLGLRYIEQVFISRENAIKQDQAWDKTPGTSVNIVTYVEDGTTGIEAEHAASALTAQSWPFIAVVKKAA